MKPVLVSILPPAPIRFFVSLSGRARTVFLRLALAGTVFFAVLPVDLSVGFDRNEPLAPLPGPDQVDPRKVDLGRALFFDPILSRHQNVSCASCHDLEAGGTIRVPRATGSTPGQILFNVPTVFNVSNNHRFGWRGSIKTLDAQNEKVLLDSNLMAITWDELVPRLEASPYDDRFRDVYGGPPGRDAVLNALASFEISLRTPDAPFDRFMRGDAAALSVEQAKGYTLFKDYGCVSCHQGSNIGGNMVQRLGLFRDDDTTLLGDDAPAGHGNAEAGRVGTEKIPDTFRVPSLRNVAITAPYFHDGRAETLPQAVSLMGRLQLGRNLSDPDVLALTAFLESLTGRYNNSSLAKNSSKNRNADVGLVPRLPTSSRLLAPRSAQADSP